MFRGIILGLLTLGGAVLFMVGMGVFLDGVPEPWHTLRWAIFMSALFFIVWRLQRAGIIDRDRADDQRQVRRHLMKLRQMSRPK